LGNNLETVTTACDGLTKENEGLKREIMALKTKLQVESLVGVEGLGSFETLTWFGVREPVSVFIVRKGRLGG
jgi:hypothetical protein